MPQINLHDHEIMMKINEVKKDKAIRRILNRRRGDKQAEIDNAALEVVEEGLVELPNGILPNNAEVLRSESEKVNMKAYSIMEWWRLTTNLESADIGTPRIKVYNSWGKLLSMISLCVPSSVAVERVFPF